MLANIDDEIYEEVKEFVDNQDNDYRSIAHFLTIAAKNQLKKEKEDEIIEAKEL